MNPMTAKKSSHICTWCGKKIGLRGGVKRLDAGNEAHWFHKGCWKSHLFLLAVKHEETQ